MSLSCFLKCQVAPKWVYFRDLAIPELEYRKMSKRGPVGRSWIQSVVCD